MQGTIGESPNSFQLDSNHTFKTGVPKRADGNTVKMIKSTRFAPHFTVEGGCCVHLGEFKEFNEGSSPVEEVNKAGQCC